MPTVLVTGSTDGIGRETARTLAAQGFDVLVHGRSEARTAAVARELSARPFVCDLSSFAAIRAAVPGLPALDVLVHNAGVFLPERTVTADGCETTFQVNHLAPFLLTALLRAGGQLTPRSRVVCVASMVHGSVRIDFDDLMGERAYSGFRAYAQSKLANVLFARGLAARGQAAWSLHPGVVGTKLLRAGFGTGGSESLEEGAATSVFLASAPVVPGEPGGYFVRRQPAAPARQALDPAVQEELFRVSAQLTGVA